MWPARWGPSWPLPLFTLAVVFLAVPVLTQMHRHRLRTTAGVEIPPQPAAVTVSADGGLAAVNVPGGPYALTADSGGGPESVGIATDPAAPRSITVSSGGGPLQIGPAT